MYKALDTIKLYQDRVEYRILLFILIKENKQVKKKKKKRMEKN